MSCEYKCAFGCCSIIVMSVGWEDNVWEERKRVALWDFVAMAGQRANLNSQEMMMNSLKSMMRKSTYDVIW